MSEMVVRPARREEIPFLTEKAREVGWHRDDLEKSVVWVVEVGGIPSGFIDVALVWQVKNLCIFPEFRRHAPPFTLRRAVFRLAQAATSWVRGQIRANGGPCSLIAYVETKRFARLCKSWGMIPLSRKGRFFGQEL